MSAAIQMQLVTQPQFDQLWHRAFLAQLGSEGDLSGPALIRLVEIDGAAELPSPAPAAAGDPLLVALVINISAEQESALLAGRFADVVHLDGDEALARARIKKIRSFALHLKNPPAEDTPVDPLTGLANRRAMLDALKARIHSAEDAPFAVLFVDLLKFRSINDHLGHSLGDRLLKRVAELMTHALGEQGALYRYGGDEFVVLSPTLDNPEMQARQLAIRLVTELDQPVEFEGKQLQVGACIGIALCPEHGRSIDALIGSADIAMYQARSRERGDVMVFSPAMDRDREYLDALRARLPDALRERQLSLHFQPVIDLVSQRVASAEALVRWEDPELGLIPPADFVPQAEALGLSEALAMEVMILACNQVKAWAQIGLTIPVAINLSALQLEARDGLKKLIDVVQQQAVHPGNIYFELTQQMLFDETEAKLELLSEAQRHGFRIIVDDFGRGLSSLSNLVRLPASAFKVDRSFVSAMNDDETAHQIVTSALKLAHSMGRQVIAEGVETEEQRTLLINLGCEFGQGFLFAHPMPGAIVAEWYRQQQDAMSETQ